jgi:hypothetical protein
MTGTEEIVAIYSKGSELQRKGDFDSARVQFQEILTFDDIDKEQFWAGSYFHLAQMAADFNQKREYLERCLLLNENYRAARVLLDCLTPGNERRLKDRGPLKQFFEKHLLNLQVQTVSACNGLCVMCPYHGSWHKKHPGTMNDRTFGHIIEMMRGIPLGKICIYLENEPFLDRWLFQRVGQIKEKLHFRSLEISTNVSLFNEKNLQLLVESLNGVDHEVWLSWHGITPETYKELMGFDFETNLEKLKNYFKITKGKLYTVINSIIGSKLVKDRQYAGEEETVSFFKTILKECGINDLSRTRFKPFHYHDRAGSIRIDGEMDKELQELEGKLKPGCWRIKEWLHILYDGDIILCCMDYHKETVMGNVNDFKSLEELLTSSRFLETQNKALGITNAEENFICRRCLSPGG